MKKMTNTKHNHKKIHLNCNIQLCESAVPTPRRHNTRKKPIKTIENGEKKSSAVQKPQNSQALLQGPN
jgi:hypothetical protein